LHCVLARRPGRAVEDGTLRLWEVVSGRLRRTFEGHERGVESVAFSPDGRSVLSGSDDRTLKLWDVASGEVLETFPPGTGDGLKLPPDATPLSAASAAETEYYRAFCSTTLPDAVGIQRLRAKMLRLPANIGWEQVTAHYQTQIANDWKAESADRKPRGLGLRVRVWRRGDRHFAVGLVDETLQDGRGPYHTLLVMSQPGE
jgi:hypothetical protein